MEKPLPDIPQTSTSRPRDAQITNPATLTVEAREHLQEFILRAIKDEGAAGSTVDGAEEWANALESALGVLGERIAMGGWLAGSRRARAIRREVEERKRERERDAGNVKKESTEASTLRTDESKAKATSTGVQDIVCRQDHRYLSIGRHDGCNCQRTERSWRADFQSLGEAISRQVALPPKPTAKHLLLTVSPFGALQPQSSNDLGYEFVPSTAQCTFTASAFALPQEPYSESDVRGAIICGLDSWDWDASLDKGAVQVVGGTFSLQGTETATQHAALTKVLRLSVFVYLSNILEQSLLADSHVPLRFPKPSLSPTTQAGASVSRTLSTSHVGHKPKREAGSLTGWWAFISRKKDHLLQRATPLVSGHTRRGSLELPLTRSLTPDGAFRTAHAQTSTDSTGSSPTMRSRRFSLIPDYRPSFLQSPLDGHDPPRDRTSVERPFATALARIEQYRALLSTSPSVSLAPPSLLVALADQEKSDPERKLCGDEKTALGSLLGWEGKNASGAGMADMTGFVRQQSFSVLYSEYVRQPTVSTSLPTTPGASNASSSSLSSSQPPSQIQATQPMLCGKRRRWMTFRFFSRDTGADDCLGDLLFKLCCRASEPCDEPNCRSRRGEHELRFTHGSLRVTATIASTTETSQTRDAAQELPDMWQSCVICGKETSKQRMHDGTYLFSFAKFLEILIYSPTLSAISPSLCQHTTLPQRPWTSTDTPIPQARMNILRKFSLRGRSVTFSLSPVEDVYEVRVPRLQILRTKANERSSDRDIRSPELTTSLEADKRALRREMMRFWQGLSEHIDELEGNFVNDHPALYQKRLPRLPSADDAYDTFDDGGFTTPKGLPSSLPPLPPNTPRTPGTAQTYPFPDKSTSVSSTAGPQSESTPSTISSTSTTISSTSTTISSTSTTISSTSTTISSTSTTSTDQDSLQRLTTLRHTFQRTEQELYIELSHTPTYSLNDARRSFLSAARGATKRLCAWEAKHAARPPLPSDPAADTEPEWWKTGCHAVPGGNVIVREDDWGSIIAFTLSSVDYQKELVNMSASRSAIVSPVTPSASTPLRPSFFGKTASVKWFGSPAASPDPDQEGIVWHEPETYSAVISRKEHPRDPTSLLKLGLPDVLRQKALPDSPGTGPSKFATIGLSMGKGLAVGAPPDAWSKPEVQVSREEADGLLTATTIDKIDKVLHDLEAVSDGPKSARAGSSETHLSSSTFVETNIRRGKASSIMSTDSDATTMDNSHNSTVPPTPPPKDTDFPKEMLTPQDTSSSEKPEAEPQTPPLPSRFANTISSALQYMLGTGDTPSAPAKHHHGLLSATASPAIDEKPHIKYDWTIGKRLKFSCTVYYAKQFDALRRRCGIEDTFLHSLSRCENWTAEGGKSRSNFWRTTDNQFIIKTLVNAWNVADLHVLIELGPSYFRYMDATTSRPTVLAKLLGFYTVEIKNLETGTTQAKADLLIMENLFYKQNIVKTFDLKGIQGRKVKPSSSSSGAKTLFDGEWIEDQQRTLTLVRPHSKVVLQEAIKADSDFLVKSNIMDYSLLVGIDESRKQLACGLVDTIGSYTFAKTLEYKAKQGLNSGKEVTVVPPHEYQERFVNAMDSYFVACPDKWSRPLDDTKIPSDYRRLPSVI